MLRADDFLQAYSRLPDYNNAFEDLLTASPLFREHRLQLHCQLIYFICSSWMEIKYLVVKDHIPVLKFALTEFRPDDNERYTPGTVDSPPQLIVYTKKRNPQEQVDNVTACLESLLKSSNQLCRKRDTHVPVPQEYREAMARLYMIRPRRNTDTIWSPTLYGASLGLVDGYMVTDQGKPCHTFFIPSERKAELDRALAWPRTCREEDPQAVMSLEQRLKKARKGLPCSNASAIEPVRAFGAMHLADYMAPFPKYAEKLHQRFGEVKTFQEAADRIFQVCISGNMSIPNMKDCIDLMTTLMIPILETCQRPSAPGLASASKIPTLDPYHGTVPLSPATEPMAALMRLSFPSLLMGAAMAAGQPCLLQNTQFILDDVLEGKADKLQTSCWTLANYPFRLYLLDDCPETDKERQKNFNMLFYLFIQPFALLNRSPALSGGAV